MFDTPAAEAQRIHQILLKPADKVSTNEQGELSAEYMDYLRSSLITETVPDDQAAAGEGGIEIQLNYVRPMSAGVHVLQVEPAMEREAVVAMTATLSGLDDVEYAEPDFPRSRR